MSRYIDGKRPEPGRLVRHVEKVVVEKETSPALDNNAVSAIADAVIKALGTKGVATGGSEGAAPTVGRPKKDEFDSSASLAKLADAMTVQRGSSEANFEDLGKVKKTKKDDGSVDKTIDLLSNIDEGE
jgi:hypothetical protein